MIVLEPLPYPENALEPVISARTVQFHYGKHHQGYVNTLNTLIENTPYAQNTLEDIINKSFGKDVKIFQNAAQVWNHAFYWKGLSPVSQKIENGPLHEAIVQNFESVDALLKALVQEGLTQFGSGWAWLVSDMQGKLFIQKTANAELPLGYIPLFTCDVWEHAYYLDYQNRRADYLKDVLKLICWDFVQQRYARVKDFAKYDQNVFFL